MKKIISLLALILFIILLSACSQQATAPEVTEGVTELPVTQTEAPAELPEQIDSQQATPTPTLPEPVVTLEPPAEQLIAMGTVNVQGLNLRIGPGMNHAILRLLSQGLELQIEGRSESLDWLLVRLPSGVQGWVFAEFVDTQVTIADLPLREAYGGAYQTQPQAELDERKPMNIWVTIENNRAVVTISGFPGNARLSVYMGKAGGSADLLVASGLASANGNAVIVFEMPASLDGKALTSGEYILLVESTGGNASMTAAIQYYRTPNRITGINE
jgi:SH3-like domain-containing protein